MDQGAESFVSVIVYGPGYGESIIIHIPEVGWGVVDSCLSKNKRTSQNPALDYLKEKNVERLSFIVLTHPHEDHYHGLAEIVDYYLGRIDRICFYSGNGIREYREYLARKEILDPGGLIGLAAIFKKFREARLKGANVIRLAERTEIIRKRNLSGYEVELLSLSPSAESIDKYVELLFEAIPKKDGDVIKYLTDSQHNLLSSAIWCSIGDLKILLGSDVEIGDSDNSGWRGILGNIDRPNLASDLVKVPHHGSPTAFFKPAWEKFSENGKPFSVITPFVRLLEPLPRDKEVKQIASFSNHVAITSKLDFAKPKKVYDRVVLKHFRGVRNWNCIEESEQIGCVSLKFSIKGGSLIESEIRPPAYLYRN